MKSSTNLTIPIDPSDPGFAIENLPFHWIIKLSNRYTQIVEDKKKKVGLTLNAWRVGITLNEQGTLSVGDIPSHVSGRMPTIAKTIGRMKEMGLVSVQTDETDARVTNVSITPKGTRLIEQLVDQRIDLYKRAFKDLNDYELFAVNGILKKLFHDLGQN